jgi:RNA polymerase sigma-70 factor (ECF subfamily)
LCSNGGASTPGRRAKGTAEVVALAEDGVGKAPPVAGDAAAQRDFTECYAASFRPLVTQLYVYTGDLELAHDLVQEAFCRALDRWSKVAGYEDPVAWVRRVAFNLANSRWQRTKVALRHLRRQRVEHVAGPNPDRVAVVRALAGLPDAQRRVVVMHYLADLGVAEIAAHEGVPVGTVKSWLHRGRTALAGLIVEGANGV